MESGAEDKEDTRRVGGSEPGASERKEGVGFWGAKCTVVLAHSRTEEMRLGERSPRRSNGHDARHEPCSCRSVVCIVCVVLHAEHHTPSKCCWD